jgi:4-amino-4-deoxy-L-arabinose transferase-like glycosyltransferase
VARAALLDPIMERDPRGRRPVFLRTGNLFSIPSFEPLVWIAASYLVVRILDEDNPRLWPWVGLAVGVGLLVKHTTLFFGFGLAVGLLATPEGRRHLRSPWLYLGGAVALAVFLPNLLWQAAHGWPTVEFLRHLRAETLAEISRLQFVLGQFRRGRWRP